MECNPTVHPSVSACENALSGRSQKRLSNFDFDRSVASEPKLALSHLKGFHTERPFFWANTDWPSHSDGHTVLKPQMAHPRWMMLLQGYARTERLTGQQDRENDSPVKNSEGYGFLFLFHFKSDNSHMKRLGTSSTISFGGLSLFSAFSFCFNSVGSMSL